MNLRNRLAKLERTKRKVAAEAACICFPPEESPHLQLRPEIEAARAVRCPLQGERFKNFAATIYRVISRPAHLDRAIWSWHSAQCIKAMDASFPPDLWPAKKIVETDGTVRFVLKDGGEIHRLRPRGPVYDYTSGELAGFVEGRPPKFKAISAADSEHSDWEQPL
jgi:hypothetical protein